MYYNDGYLEIIIGTMFSGKTSYLLHKISQMIELDLRVLYINIDLDNRSDKNYSTHNVFLDITDYKKKDKIEKNLTMIKVGNLMHVLPETFVDYDVIMIDEAHFFKELVLFTKILLENKKNIFIGSLIADYMGNKFGNALELIPICNNIVKLDSYCVECSKKKIYNKAVFSKKISVKDVEGNKVVDIGGADKYIPVCREHFSDMPKKQVSSNLHKIVICSKSKLPVYDQLVIGGDYDQQFIGDDYDQQFIGDDYDQPFIGDDVVRSRL
jgi:thymidine kinase